MMEGLVIRTTGSWHKVLVENGERSIDCRLRGNYRLRGNKQTNPVAVGDRVLFDLEDDGTGVIHEVRDRSNYIVRRATKLSKQTHVIAANIDLLCIVATLGLPRTSTGFIDRLLVTAEAYHIPAAIIFNKCDLLVDDELRTLQQELSNLYRAIGYPVLEISALEGTGIDEVKELIAGRTVLFSGHSGVGKSALLNALSPDLALKVGDISDWSLKGRHTTTFAEIHPVQLSGNQAIKQSHRHPRHQGVWHGGLHRAGTRPFLSRDAQRAARLPLRQLHPPPRARLRRPAGRRRRPHQPRTLPQLPQHH